MTVKNQELYNVIEKLPEELSVKVLDYIEYLMFSNANNNAPEELYRILACLHIKAYLF